MRTTLASQSPRQCFAHARLAAALLAVALAALLCGPAQGQGTSGSLPDPVSLGDLTRWLDRWIKPDSTQWTTIERAHDAYKTDFQRLREGEIESFMKSQQAMAGRMPERTQMKAILDEQERLFRKVAGLDTRLLDSIQASLTDDQIPRMERVRLARQRATYRTPMTMGAMGGMPAADLSELISNLDLSREELAAIDPLLADYERQYTRRLKEGYEASARMFMDLFESLERQGFGAGMDQEELMGDPERMKSFMAAMEKAWAEAAVKTREASYELAQVNHRYRKDLQTKLPQAAAQRLRRETVARSYPFALAGGQQVEGVLEAAVRLKAIEPDQREALERLLADWRRDDEALEWKQIEVLDEVNRTRSPFDVGVFQEGEENPQQEIAQKRRDLAESAIERAKGMVGPELAAKLQNPDLSDTAVFAPEGGAVAAAAEPEEESPFAGIDWEGRAVPRAIDVAAIARWSGRLGLTSGERDLLDSLHSEYLAAWQATVEPSIAAIEQAQSAPSRRIDPEAGPEAWTGPTEAEYQAIHAARRAAREAAAAADGRLFDDIAATMTSDARANTLAALRLERDLRSPPGLGGLGGLIESEEARVNLVEVVGSTISDPGNVLIADAVLAHHADALRTDARAYFEASVANQEAMERLSVEMARRFSEGENAASAGIDFQTRMRDSSERAEAAAAKYRATMRAALDELAAALPPDRAAALRRAFNREAFPQVYNDQRSAAPFLEKAAGMNDLTDADRAALAAIASEFDAAYAAASERMVEVARQGSGTMPGMDPEAWKGWQERRNRMERIRFERDEASMKAVRRVRDLLGEERSRRIPGLDTYTQQRRSEFEFLP